MKIVLDTNVLLISIAKKSPHRPIFDAIIEGKIRLVLTNEILSEYAEILEQRTNEIVAVNITEFLSKSNYVDKIEVYYKWNLIEQDADDNKFVDAAIAGNANFIVTNDKHFNILETIDFPKVEIITSSAFLDLVQKL